MTERGEDVFENYTDMGDDPSHPNYTAIDETLEFRPISSAGKAVVGSVRRAGRSVVGKAAELKQRVKRGSTHVSIRAREIRRRLITGDSQKRVRDYALEVPVVKTVDKFSFMLGILILNITQAVLCLMPTKFARWFCIIMPPLLIVRIFSYRKKNWHYFLYDFCYFVNILTFLAVVFDVTWMKQLVFIYANGPICYAILVWRNNMVFHSVEQITSVFIHGFPALLTYCWRWHSESQPNTLCDTASHPGDCDLMDNMSLTWPIVGYFLWQIYYFWVTEIRDKEVLDSDDTLQSSVRYMARKGGKNITAQAVVKLCKKLKIMGKDEKLDDRTVKTRVIFMTSQLAYTLLCLLPMPLLFRNQAAHGISLAIVYISSIWNGAGFYIEVFSAQYVKKFQNAANDRGSQGVSGKNFEEHSRRPLTPSEVNAICELMVTCDELEPAIGKLYCVDCKLVMCPSCDEHLHKKQQKEKEETKSSKKLEKQK
eukprot:m.170028 g.170028  ORF g.170028 m.170028 type:complete len:481 (+) comp15334_c1_seq5:349-1791(+)